MARLRTPLPLATVSALATHANDLIRLAAPVIVSRSGVMVMALVDTVMVGHFSARELAYLGIGLAPITAILLAMMGLVMGTLVVTATAHGRGEDGDCGRAWRRSLPYAFGLGVIGALLCAPGSMLLRLLGQEQGLAAGGGPVVHVLGLGLPAMLVSLTTMFFLEGIRRPLPGMVMMIAANFLNIGLNWALVYGHLGFPAMGALGSAWATTVMRICLAAGLIAYVWTMRDHHRFGIRTPAGGRWRDWAWQRRIGYAAGCSIGVEAAAFGMVSVFAGWLGVVPLAAFSIGLNLISMVFMVAVGLGTATAVRVGMAHGRHDAGAMALAGWTGLFVNTVAMSIFAVAFAAFPALVTGAYTTDDALRSATIPLVTFSAWVLVVDGGQVVMANALRGRGETWIPTALHAFSYFGVMIPVAWILAFPVDHGAMGLFEGILIASIASVTLLAVRFHLLCRRDKYP